MGGVQIKEHSEHGKANKEIFQLQPNGQWTNDTVLERELETAVPALCQYQQGFAAVGGYRSQSLFQKTVIFDIRRSARGRPNEMPLSPVQKYVIDNARFRHRHAGIVTCKDVYAIGGVNTEGTIIAHVDRLDPHSKRWELCPPCPIRNAFPIVAAGEDRIYAIENTCPYNRRRSPPNSGTISEGFTVAMFDTQNNKWYPSEPLPGHITSTSGANAVFEKGRLYVFGGDKRLCECYNSCGWYGLQIPKYCHSFGAKLSYDGKLYLLGGFDGDDVIEEYDIATNKWHKWDIRLPKPLQYHTAMLF